MVSRGIGRFRLACDSFLMKLAALDDNLVYSGRTSGYSPDVPPIEMTAADGGALVDTALAF